MARVRAVGELRRKWIAVWYLLPVLLLLALLAYLLWMPLELRIDSSSRLFYIRAGVLARVSLEPEPEELVQLHLRAGFWHFYWRPADFQARVKPRKKGRKPSGSMDFSGRRALRLLRSFRVRQFRWNLDTGNPALNARLYPVFYLLDGTLGGFGINFQDHNRLELHLVNRPVRILLALVKH